MLQCFKEIKPFIRTVCQLKEINYGEIHLKSYHVRQSGALEVFCGTNTKGWSKKLGKTLMKRDVCFLIHYHLPHPYL